MIPNINLLPKYERPNPLYFFIIALLFIIWFSLLAFFIYQYVTAKDKLETLNARIEQLNVEKEQLEEEIDTKPKEDEDWTFEEALAFVEQKILPTSVLIHELIRMLPDNGYLSKYRYSAGAVSIETQFEKIGDGADYIAKLVASKYVRDAKVDEASTFLHSIPNEQIVVNPYDVVPRYHMYYSLDVHFSHMREELKRND